MSTQLAAVAIDTMVQMNPSTIVLISTAPGTRVKGRWIDGIPTETPIIGCIWHMKATEERDLADEDRRDEMRVFWTRDMVSLVDVDTTQDQVRFRGFVYDIIKVNERYEGSYYRAIIGRNIVRTNSV